MLSVVADSAIPLLQKLLTPHVALQVLPADAITAAALKKADALLVRSVTQVDANLLAHTAIKFVGTATSGTDHLDSNALQQRGISWASSSGANAQAVTEYVMACVALLQTQGKLATKNLKCGVIGAGKIGSKVTNFLTAIGAKVLVNDPPRANTEKNFISTPLSDFIDCDLITAHVPLSYEGHHRTFHLIDQALLSQQRKCVLINSSRGEVVDTAVLKKMTHITACLDVWENEPSIDYTLLQQSLVATPHIAGYTTNAKYLASLMLYKALMAFFTITPPVSIQTIAKKYQQQHIIPIKQQQAWQTAVLNVYNPMADTLQLKGHNNKNIASHFKTLREQYHFRPSFDVVPELTPNSVTNQWHG